MKLTPPAQALEPRTSDRVALRKDRTSRRAAFTLVEILIAISLLTLIIVAIYSSWTAILRASKVGLEAAASAQRARIVIRTLEDSLGSAEAFAVHMQQHPEYYTFLAENGNEASLSFVARLAKSFPRSGKFGDLDVRRLTFSVEPAADGGRHLVLRQNALLLEMDKDEKVHPIVLAKNVQKFEFAFWDLRLGDWVDEWTQTNQLPKLVKITLALGDNPHSSRLQEEITRMVSLPAVMVQPNWQAPMLPPGLPPGTQPGTLPGTQPGVAPGTQPGVLQPGGGGAKFGR